MNNSNDHSKHTFLGRTETGNPEACTHVNAIQIIFHLKLLPFLISASVCLSLAAINKQTNIYIYSHFILIARTHLIYCHLKYVWPFWVCARQRCILCQWNWKKENKIANLVGNFVLNWCALMSIRWDTQSMPMIMMATVASSFFTSAGQASLIKYKECHPVANGFESIIAFKIAYVG